MRLRLATKNDVGAIMAFERMPGYEALVGRWTAEEHARHLKDPAFSYYVLEDGSTPVGFVALHSQERGLLINRIAVGDAGRGIGKMLLTEVLALPLVSSAARVWLRVAVQNERAIKFYRSFGFTEIDRLTAARVLPNGVVTDLLVMARPGGTSAGKPE
jgi:ribosomal protein S18 acetylase RimI-like enzyme